MSLNQMNQPPTDSELVALCLRGDTVAFGRLIDRHRAPLERLLRAVLRDRFTQEDVWQETLLRAYLNLEQLREPARFGSWLCKIALNLARTQRSHHFPQAFSWDDLRTPDATHAGLADPAHLAPEALAIRQEAINRVRQAIASLPPAERDAVMLVYLEQLSHQEAAVQLGASLSAVKVRVHRGRERLRTALQAEFATNTKQQVKEPKMIQVNVHDVMLASENPQIGDQPTIQPSLRDLLRAARIIVLKEQAGDRAIVMWIGKHEAASILMSLEQQAVKRPLTYDLTQTLLGLGQVVIERIVINRLHESTFYANLSVKTGSTVSAVDCRPSDAINLALRLNTPIFVAEDLMEQGGFLPDAAGNYRQADWFAISQRMASTEQEKANMAKLRNTNWSSVRSAQLEQMVEQREQLLQEFVETLTNERAKLLEESEFSEFLAGFWG